MARLTEAEGREAEDQIGLAIRREHEPRDQRGDDERDQVTPLWRAETTGGCGGRQRERTGIHASNLRHFRFVGQLGRAWRGCRGKNAARAQSGHH